MKEYLKRLLETFEFSSGVDFIRSLTPTTKYSLSAVTMGVSAVSVPVEKWFGLDEMAFIALLIVFLTELLSGYAASYIRKEKFSSVRLSRFTLKTSCYVVLIYATWQMYVSFHAHGRDLAAVIFDWLNIFLTVQIAFENIISILENMSVISGNDKTQWITKIKDKLNSLI